MREQATGRRNIPAVFRQSIRLHNQRAAEAHAALCEAAAFIGGSADFRSTQLRLAEMHADDVDDSGKALQAAIRRACGSTGAEIRANDVRFVRRF